MTQFPVTIRHAAPADAQAIAEIHVYSWQWAYRTLIPDDYLNNLSATLNNRIKARRDQLTHLPPQMRCWLIEQDQSPVGFAVTGPYRDPDLPSTIAEVFAIYLSQDAAGKGIGRHLFNHAIEDLRQRGYEQAVLWVLESNMRARKFYEAAGWMPDGGRKSEERPGVILHELRYHFALC